MSIARSHVVSEVRRKEAKSSMEVRGLIASIATTDIKILRLAKDKTFDCGDGRSASIHDRETI